MAALYTHTTRTTGTILTATIYNSDHQNHIDNGIPAQLDDYSVNTTQMQLTTDPGEVGTESLAGSLAGELERLRFAIAECKVKLNGGSIPQWYSTPSGAYSGTTGTFSGGISATTGTFSGAVSGTSGTFSGAISGTTGTFSGTVDTATSTAGATQLLQVRNTDNTNGASNAQLYAVTGGAVGGDPKVVWDIASVVAWSAGLDNSDGDKWKLGASSLVGTSTLLDVTSSGVFTFTGSISCVSNIATTAGRIIGITSTQTSYTTSGIESTSNTGDVWLTLHAAGTSAATFKHVRGGSGVELRDASSALANFLANDITGARLIPTSSSVPAAGIYLPAANEVGIATNGAKRFVCDASGRIYGAGIHNSAAAPTGATNGYIASGTYTPTLTNVANVTGSTSSLANWIRVGNVVSVSGWLQIDPTAATTLSQIDISLPLASNFGATSDGGGMMAAGINPSYAGRITADPTNDRMNGSFTTGADIANQTWGYTFHYTVI